MERIDMEIANVKKRNATYKIRKAWIYITATFFGLASSTMGVRLYFMHVMAFDLTNGIIAPSYINSTIILQIWYIWAVSSFMVLVSVIMILRYSP